MFSCFSAFLRFIFGFSFLRFCFPSVIVIYHSPQAVSRKKSCEQKKGTVPVVPLPEVQKNIPLPASGRVGDFSVRLYLSPHPFLNQPDSLLHLFLRRDLCGSVTLLFSVIAKLCMIPALNCIFFISSVDQVPGRLNLPPVHDFILGTINQQLRD